MLRFDRSALNTSSKIRNHDVESPGSPEYEQGKQAFSEETVMYRRRSVEEKLAMVRETFEPGATVFGVARRHQVNSNEMFA